MRFLLPFLLLLFLLPSAQAHPWDDRNASDVTFHLVTADPGHHIGSAWFGHSGILAEVNGSSAYYAYRLHIIDSPFRGITTTFTDVDFSLHQRTFESKISEYTEQERSMRTMELLLSPEEKQRLAAGIEAELARRDDPYAYRMIHDNCSTRLRDLLDQTITGGLPALEVPIGSTVRQIGPTYVEHDVVQANLLYLFMGPEVDRSLMQGEELFLPLELESYLRDVGLGGETTTVLSYATPEPGPGHGRIVAVAGTVGLLFAGAIFGLGALYRRGDSTARVWMGGTMGMIALLTLVPALLLWLSWTDAMAPHFHDNLNVLLLSPALIAWIAVGPAWARGRGWAVRTGRKLSQVQLLLGVAAVALHLFGFQVMDASLAMFLPLHVAAWYAFTADAVPSSSEPHHPADATPAQRVG